MKGVYKNDLTRSISEYLRKRVQDGQCRACGIPNPDAGKRQLCPACRVINAESCRLYRRLKGRLGRCLSCTNPASPGRKRCETHLKAVRDAVRLHRLTNQSR